MEYMAKVLLKPIIDGYTDTIEVKEQSEEKFVRDLDVVLSETVFSAGCSNWYINKAGRNAAAWPGLASSYWKQSYWPKWDDFDFSGGSALWPLYWAKRHFAIQSLAVVAALFAAAHARSSGDLDSIVLYASRAVKGMGLS